jgi:hypothetical protein
MLSDRNDLFRLSVAQYHRLLELKILEATCQVELLEGILIENMPRQPDDNPAARRFEESVANALPARWELVRSRVLPLARSKPESAPQPDYVIRRAPSANGTNTQPSTEIGVVVEIAVVSGERCTQAKWP